MTDDNSFIIIPNSVLKADVWSKKERFSKLDAYIYLIKESRWQKTSCVIKDVKCGTNQLVRSCKELMEAWNLNNKNEVKRYLDFFETQGWIATKKFKNATQITVIKTSKCNANVTGIVTGNVTGNVTPNPTENQGVWGGEVTADVTGNVTGNVTQMLPPDDPPRAQVSFDSFTSSSNNNNIQLELELEVESPLTPQGERVKPKGYEKFDFSFADDKFYPVLVKWLDYRRNEHKFKFKSQSTVETCYKNIVQTSRNNPQAADALADFCIANSWKGYYATPSFWHDLERSRELAQEEKDKEPKETEIDWQQ